MIWAGNTKIKPLVWLLLVLALWSWWELILTISFLCWHFPACSSSPFILKSFWPPPAPPNLLKMYRPPSKKATDLQISSFALQPVSISCLLAQQRPSFGAACVLKAHADVFAKLGAKAVRSHPNSVDIQCLRQAQPAFPKTARSSLRVKF